MDLRMSHVRSIVVTYALQPEPVILNGSFLDLPPENRLLVYRHLLPTRPDVAIDHQGRLYTPCDFEGSFVGGHYRILRKKAGIFTSTCRLCSAGRNGFVVMLRTCRLVHEELNIFCYRQFHPTLDGGMVSILKAEAHLSVNIRQMITKLSFSVGMCGLWGLTERKEKPYLAAIIRSLPGLRELNIKGSDASADAGEKGTVWKPKALRRIAFILEISNNLSKVFCERLNPGDRISDYLNVRIAEVGGQAGDSEIQLDIRREYEKWLTKRRDRIGQRRGDRA